MFVSKFPSAAQGLSYYTEDKEFGVKNVKVRERTSERANERFAN